MSETKNLNDVISALQDATKGVIDYFNGLNVDDLNGHLAGYKQLYENLEEIEIYMKILRRQKEDLQTVKLPSLFDRLKIEGIKLFGRNFIPAYRFNASIPAYKQKLGFKWLQEHGLGHLISENVNAKTLSSQLSDYIQENAITPPEEAITMHRQPYVQMRKT